MEAYIGLMSGTSTDGVDGVLVDFSETPPRLCAFASIAFEPTLRAELLALNTPGDNELHRAALAANALARLYAQVVDQLLVQAGVAAQQVKAIGAHGQTVRHQPGAWDGTGYTWQINQPALLAELTGIRVIADFRSRDVAAGGQGAPLVPAFHDAWFAKDDAPVVLLNLGGISNISVLPAKTAGPQGRAPVMGFDCGPGNVLLDAWCQAHLGQPYDLSGRWAATGTVCPALLQQLLDEPYFGKAPPKSTGRDLFHWDWLTERLEGIESVLPQDVQATLVALTAQSVSQAIAAQGVPPCEVWVCGGGAYNNALMQALAKAMPERRVQSTLAQGIDPMQVEATAFAWLARQHCHQLPGNLVLVTGAKGERVLGASYPP